MEILSNDFIQDISFDYYGEKMAICSTDRKILIYSKNENNGNWIKSHEWQAHDAPIFRVEWANPEFGVILASCGFDKRVNIWQERKEDGKILWTSRATIQDFSDSVQDISFCPKVHGLKLAAATLNGKMKIFEPSDHLNNINWNCISQKDVSSVGCSSVCWNLNIFDPQTLVVGCYCDNEGKNRSDLIQIYAYNDNKKEYVFVECLNNLGHLDSITDVQWANQYGSTYHTIASSSKDGKVIIWKIDLKFDLINDLFDNIRLKYEKVFEYKHIDNRKYTKEIVRLSWNISGSLLACIDEMGNKVLIKKIDDKKYEILDLQDQ